MGKFAVMEVLDTKSEIQHRTVWAITQVSNEPLREFVYGVVPTGWKQLAGPEPLTLGQLYSVGPFSFRLQEVAGELTYEVARAGELN